MRSLKSKMFFGLRAPERFHAAVDEIFQSVGPGFFAGDNLITYGRNLGFLDDGPLFNAYQKHAATDIEKMVIWRLHTLAWAAEHGMKLNGDFVECACYRGTSVRILCDVLNFAQSAKKWFLYDLFEHQPGMPHPALDGHSTSLFSWVASRFVDAPNVIVTQGNVPSVLDQVSPEKIAFLHIDLNNAEAEVGALEKLFDRMVPGAMLVLDDYGWAAYRSQKLAEDAFLAKRGYSVLEMPTGQGLVIKC